MCTVYICTHSVFRDDIKKMKKKKICILFLGSKIFQSSKISDIFGRALSKKRFVKSSFGQKMFCPKILFLAEDFFWLEIFLFLEVENPFGPIFLV